MSTCPTCLGPKDYRSKACMKCRESTGSLIAAEIRATQGAARRGQIESLTARRFSALYISQATGLAVCTVQQYQKEMRTAT